MADVRGMAGLVPVVQAPMAGVSTPALAAAVSRAGALGFLGLGAMDAGQAAAAMAQTAALLSGHDRPSERGHTAGWGVNLFCHTPTPRDPQAEAAWCAALAPRFAAFGAAVPTRLHEIYPTFTGNDAMMRAVLDAAPCMVSFHFGLPHPDQISALRQSGAALWATATSLSEAQAIRAAGLDGIIAQGWQAGGHRGMFDPAADDARLSTCDLVRLLVPEGLPVIAAGGIMDRTDVRLALAAGAVAVQCGTAFLRCPEAATSAAHRAALSSGRTQMTRVISGRPARCARNLFTDLDPAQDTVPPAGYPMAYDVGKALNVAALAAGETGYGAFWAGTGCADARALPAAQVVATLTP